MERVVKRIVLVWICAAVVLFGRAEPSEAQDCEVHTPFVGGEAAAVFQALRCLSQAVDKLRRENNTLKARIEALETLAGELPAVWSNVDGVITEEADRPIGSASFVLSSRSTGGANTLPIDQRIVEELCDKSGGCTLTIALKQLSLFDRTPKNSTISGPCQFSYAARTGAWAVSAGCGAGESSSGVDGDGGLVKAQTNSAEIAVAGGACLLTDSGLAKAVGRDASLASDRSKGLFLVAIPSRHADGSRRFQCDMSLE